jgi:hypothetical protein
MGSSDGAVGTDGANGGVGGFGLTLSLKKSRQGIALLLPEGKLHYVGSAYRKEQARKALWIAA